MDYAELRTVLAQAASGSPIDPEMALRAQVGAEQLLGAIGGFCQIDEERCVVISAQRDRIAELEDALLPLAMEARPVNPKGDGPLVVRYLAPPALKESHARRAWDLLAQVVCPACESVYTGLPDGACSDCLNTRMAHPEITKALYRGEQ